MVEANELVVCCRKLVGLVNYGQFKGYVKSEPALAQQLLKPGLGEGELTIAVRGDHDMTRPLPLPDIS